MVVRAGRARQRDLVRRGYDAISLAYRSDDGEAAASSAEDVIRYAGWVRSPPACCRPEPVSWIRVAAREYQRPAS